MLFYYTSVVKFVITYFEFNLSKKYAKIKEMRDIESQYNLFINFCFIKSKNIVEYKIYFNLLVHI